MRDALMLCAGAALGVFALPHPAAAGVKNEGMKYPATPPPPAPPGGWHFHHPDDLELTTSSTTTSSSTTSTTSTTVAPPPATASPPPTTSPPATSPPASAGGWSGPWACIAEHESGGNPATDTGNGYYGGLQFTEQTWLAYGGTGNPADASIAEQEAVAERVLAGQGWAAWPTTSRECGYR